MSNCREGALHMFKMVALLQGRFATFSAFARAFMNVKFDGNGVPDTANNCTVHATLKLQNLADATILQELCCAVGSGDLC